MNVSISEKGLSRPCLHVGIGKDVMFILSVLKNAKARVKAPTLL